MYHWLSLESAEALAANANFQEEGFPLKALAGRDEKSSWSTLLAKWIPDLQSRRGLFVWSNPVAGMGSGAGNDRLYGDHLVDQLMLAEWLILNPKAVVSFTGDPSKLQLTIEPWLEKMEDPLFKFSDRELHSNAMLFENYKERTEVLAPIIKDYLAGGKPLPPFFMRGSYFHCVRLFRN